MINNVQIRFQNSEYDAVGLNIIFPQKPEHVQFSVSGQATIIELSYEEVELLSAIAIAMKKQKEKAK